MPQADCTESYAAPAVDGLLAIGLGVAAAVAFAQPASTSGCNPQDHNQDFCISGGGGGKLLGAALLVPTGLFAFSAYHGGSTVGDCRDAHAQDTSTLTAPATPAPRAKPWNPDE